MWKWLDTGEVEFRIDAVSQASRGSHPLVDVGFRIFGRGKQKQFARNGCERMARLTREARSRTGDRPAAPRPNGELSQGSIAVRPTQAR